MTNGRLSSLKKVSNFLKSSQPNNFSHLLNLGVLYISKEDNWLTDLMVLGSSRACCGVFLNRKRDSNTHNLSLIPAHHPMIKKLLEKKKKKKKQQRQIANYSSVCFQGMAVLKISGC